jgi:hypothetical protein
MENKIHTCGNETHKCFYIPEPPWDKLKTMNCFTEEYKTIYQNSDARSFRPGERVCISEKYMKENDFSIDSSKSTGYGTYVKKILPYLHEITVDGGFPDGPHKGYLLKMFEFGKIMEIMEKTEKTDDK